MDLKRVPQGAERFPRSSKVSKRDWFAPQKGMPRAQREVIE